MDTQFKTFQDWVAFSLRAHTLEEIVDLFQFCENRPFTQISIKLKGDDVALAYLTPSVTHRSAQDFYMSLNGNSSDVLRWQMQGDFYMLFFDLVKLWQPLISMYLAMINDGQKINRIFLGNEYSKVEKAAEVCRSQSATVKQHAQQTNTRTKPPMPPVKWEERSLFHYATIHQPPFTYHSHQRVWFPGPIHGFALNQFSQPTSYTT